MCQLKTRNSVTKEDRKEGYCGRADYARGIYFWTLLNELLHGIVGGVQALELC
jgi:hypothetical protein